MKPPTYGTSTHYEGASGEDYFTWQNEHGQTRGRINARKFQSAISDDAVVLDFGCGGGHLLDALVCRTRIGVEVNPVARAQAAELGIRVHADISEVPGDLVDVAVSNHALEHVPYPIEALREIRRVLKPRGRLLLSVPIDDWRTQRAWESSDINHHLHTWTPLLLGNTLAEAGFDANQARIGILTHAWPPHWDWVWRTSPQLFDAAARVWAVLKRRRQLYADVPAGDLSDSV